jgi:hypothetical protein
MLYAGLDLSRKRLDFHLLDAEGVTVDVEAASPPDADGLRALSQRLELHGAPVRATIASMNGAWFVHDRLELVELAGRDRRCAEGERTGTARLQDRPDRRLGAGRAPRGAISCRRSGYRIRSSVRSASGRAGGCTSSATGRA